MQLVFHCFRKIVYLETESLFSCLNRYMIVTSCDQREKSPKALVKTANPIHNVTYSRKSSRGFFWLCFPMMTLSTRTETHAKLNAFLWPELKQEWQMSFILLYWVMTVISWPYSDVNPLTGRAGRWYKSSFLFSLQFVHCKMKRGVSILRQGMYLILCI